MYLHIVHPDPKFPRHIQALFESVDQGNHMFVFYKTADRLESFPTGFQNFEDEESLREIVNSCDDWDGIILHGVLENIAPYVSILPRVAVGWFFWGFELYKPAFRNNEGLYGSLTSKLFSRREKQKSFRGNVARIYNKWCERIKKYESLMLPHVDLVITPFKEEYDLFRKLKIFTNRQQWFNAPTLTLGKMVDLESEIRTAEGDLDILVGNSAYPTNNHLEVFDKLKDHDLTGRKVVVPLTYGNDTYREKILKIGQEMLGDSFDPIIDHLSLTAYLEKVDRCGIVIMNHARQQAVGNITNALWEGKTVYLGKSSLLPGYRNLGFPVRSFQRYFNIERKCAELAEIQFCREKLISFVGERASEENIENLLKTLTRLTNESARVAVTTL